MTKFIPEDPISLISRFDDISRQLRSILDDDRKSNKGDKEAHSDWYNQFENVSHEFDELLLKLRSIAPDQVIPGTSDSEDEEIINGYRSIGQEDAYPVMKHLKIARSYLGWEMFQDEDDATLANKYLKMLINFPFFDPDNWMKREDALKPLYIKGPGIPTWLLARYKEAVYSHIYGFYNAAITMCRSIIEGIVRNKIGDTNCSRVELKDRLEFYMKTVKDVKHKQAAWSAQRIRKLANDVLHDIRQSANEKKSKETLMITREFIKTAY